MKAIIEDRPKSAPTVEQEMRKHERAKNLAVWRSARLASQFRTDRHARLKIVEEALERKMTPGVREAAMKERQRLIHFLTK